MVETANAVGVDQPLATNAPSVIKAIMAYKEEARVAKKERMTLSRLNRNTYLGTQDWSHKQKGQSAEFLPKTPIAVEQMSAFVKRALVQFGNWFSVKMGPGQPSPLTPDQIREMLKCFFAEILVENQKSVPLHVVITDAIKIGLLESLMIVKVHGQMVQKRRFVVESGEPVVDPETLELEIGEDTLVAKEEDTWRLRIDLIKPEDYFPDPTGNGLFEIHSVERDLHNVVEMSEGEDPVYDPAVVAQLVTDFKQPEEDKRKPQAQNQKEAKSPTFRKKVLIDEFWGTFLDDSGRVTHKNVVAAVANGKFLIRKPEPNPFWHQESPFVVSPLIRVPFSVWHKALYDHGSPLNLALNELFNLMLDGGISQVWGIKQIKMDMLEDPRQVSGGVQQGSTLAVKSTTAPGDKVVETVAAGEVPRDAMAIFELLQGEFAQAVLSNELKLGNLPPSNTKATAIVEQSQSQAVTLDSLTADVEKEFIAKMIRKGWLTVMQNADSLDSEQIIAAIGTEGALALSRMSSAQRFAVFGDVCQFQVFGLSQTLTKGRDFQKIMAMLQAVATNPVLLQAFFKRFSGDKTLTVLMKALNVNPDELEKDEAEQARVAEDFQELQTFLNITGAGSQQGSPPAPPSDQGAGPETPAEINQLNNPLTGFTGNEG